MRFDLYVSRKQDRMGDVAQLVEQARQGEVASSSLADPEPHHLLASSPLFSHSLRDAGVCFSTDLPAVFARR